MNTTDGRACILIGSGRDGAGVQNNNFCIRRSRSTLQTALFKLAFDGSAIGLRRAATKILYVKTRHRTIVAAHPGPKANWSNCAPHVGAPLFTVELQPRITGSFTFLCSEDAFR